MIIHHTVPGCLKAPAPCSPVHTTLTIYSILGQEVRRLVEEQQSTGYCVVSWDGTNSTGKEVPSGIYFFRLKAGDLPARTVTMLLLQ